jgi:hypothetical protein
LWYAIGTLGVLLLVVQLLPAAVVLCFSADSIKDACDTVTRRPQGAVLHVCFQMSVSDLPATFAATACCIPIQHPPQVFETLFYWPANVEKPIRKALLATAFNFIPAKLVGQFLDSHGSASGLTNCRGSFLYADPDVLGMCKVGIC